MANYKGGKNRQDTFIGNQASDRFLFDPADLTAADVIVGGDGKGRDVLVFNRAGTISADALANVMGIEEIRLSAGGNTIALTQGLIDSARGNGLVVKGGKGADRINASAITDRPDGNGAFRILGGAGDDVLIGGRDDRLVLDGGKGADTIVVEEGAAVYDSADLSITGRGDDARLAISTGMTLDLTRKGDLTDGDRAVVTGFVNVDASASRQSVTLIGADTSMLTGGSGNDTIIGGQIVRGGKGADTIIGRVSPTNYQTFEVFEGEFVAGDSIVGRNMLDQLLVTGSADLRVGTLEGIDLAVIFGVKGTRTKVSAYASQLGAISTQTYEGEVSVDLYLDVPGAYRNTATYSYDVTLRGTGKADQIDVQVMNVSGGGGDDVIAASGGISGGAGDDQITFRNSSGAAVTIDGGQGRDTLALSNYGGGTLNLSTAKNQLLTGSATVRGFEDLDLAGWSGWTVTGSKAANRIAGSSAVDTLSGGAGDDVLEGRGSADVLTGGEGRDTFRWSERDDFTDIITDFSRKDVLSFDAADFRVSGGAMDTRLVGDARPADLHGVDLFVYTGGILNSFVGVLDILPGEAGRDASGGLFVAGRTGAGNTVLFHAAFDGSAVQVDPIATLGTLVAPEDLSLSQFTFI